MILRNKSDHTRAFAFSVILVAVIGLLILVFFNRPGPEATEEEFSPFVSRDSDKPLTSDAIATLGQKYIKELASYSAGEEVPILLKNVELLEEGLWLARYETESQFAGRDQVYFYTLQVRDGRVVDHNVSVSDGERTLLLSNPQPNEIMGAHSFIIKGQLFNGGTDVELEVIEEESSAVIASYQVASDKNDRKTYTQEVVLPARISGRVIIKAVSGNAEVRIPVVISTMEQ